MATPDSPSLKTLPSGPPFHRNSPANKLGESPLYRLSDNTLHWIDIFGSPNCTLHILSLSNPVTERIISISEQITSIYFRFDMPGSYIASTISSIIYLSESDGQFEKICEVLTPAEVKAGMRLNDAGVDAAGRFWIGCVDMEMLKGAAKNEGHPDGGLEAFYAKGGRKAKGCLWRWEGNPKEKPKVMETGIAGSNGMAWKGDGTKMFYNDSVAQKTFVYDFDLRMGNISNRKTLVHRIDGGGENDGMVIDTKDNLWIALWRYHSVICFDGNTGAPLLKIEVPAKLVTCPVWGGKDYKTLFVTSATFGFDGDKSEPITKDGGKDEGGHLFAWRPEDHGLTGIGGREKGVFRVQRKLEDGGSRI